MAKFKYKETAKKYGKGIELAFNLGVVSRIELESLDSSYYLDRGMLREQIEWEKGWIKQDIQFFETDPHALCEVAKERGMLAGVAGFSVESNPYRKKLDCDLHKKLFENWLEGYSMTTQAMSELKH